MSNTNFEEKKFYKTIRNWKLNETNLTFDEICYVVYRGKSGTYFFFLDVCGNSPAMFPCTRRSYPMFVNQRPSIRG